jgi:hypothetical protein
MSQLSTKQQQAVDNKLICTRSEYPSFLAPVGADGLRPCQTSTGTLGLATLNEKQGLGGAAARDCKRRPDLTGGDGAPDARAVVRARGPCDDGARRGRRTYGRQRDETGDDTCGCWWSWGGGRGRSWPASRWACYGGRAELNATALIRTRGFARCHEGRRWD